MILIRLFYYSILILTISGCINGTTALRLHNTDISRDKTFYLIEQPEDKDNHKIIKANLEARGYKVTSGPEQKPPYSADFVVTYLDKWWWDLAPYMIELTVVFRDPTDLFPIVGGNSYHTSLSRLTEENMTDEVLTNMFNAKPIF